MTENCAYANKNQIISIVRRALSCIDERLVNHGERVAYIADHIAEIGGGLGLDREKLLILSVLHDIGAYKTEEIDDMVCFETVNALDHAAFGYVFLKYTTSLGRQSEALLYHHTRYDHMAEIDTPFKTAAELIYLADRIDILLGASDFPEWDSLRRLGGTVFSPELVELFFKAEEKYDLSRHIRDMTYFKDIEQKLEALCLTQDESFSFLQMLVFSIDFRSPFTVTHTANTTAISGVLAELCGLDEREQRAVTLGAFLHDIGKIAIPYSILENPGRLSDTEMDVMRTHVALSEEILSGVVDDEVCQIAVRHHEKMNGRGYYQRLSSEDLTTAQRIVAVADVMSALTGRRSYKEPFSKERTTAILQNMAVGGELCPRICEVAIENYDTIISFVGKANDPIIELYEKIKQEYVQLRENHVS